MKYLDEFRDPALAQKLFEQRIVHTRILFCGKAQFVGIAIHAAEKFVGGFHAFHDRFVDRFVILFQNFEAAQEARGQSL